MCANEFVHAGLRPYMCRQVYVWACVGERVCFGVRASVCVCVLIRTRMRGSMSICGDQRLLLGTDVCLSARVRALLCVWCMCVRVWVGVRECVCVFV